MMNMKNFKFPTFVKWAGGKTQLLEQFSKFFPKKFNGYLEPFIGSGSVFFYIKKNYSLKRIVLSDLNEELITCFEIVRDDVERLIKLLIKHKENHSKEYYYKIRDLDVSKLSKIEIAARLIYLNKTCYNGLYRVNAEGKFNVPMGKYRNPQIVNEINLRKASELLQNVELKSMPFEHVLDFAKKGDFVYLDPPYYPLTKTSSFTSYTNNAFLEKEQEKLSEVFRQLDKRECFVMLSNSDHPFIRNLYKDFSLHTVKALRTINCIGKKRGKISELVITNYKAIS